MIRISTIFGLLSFTSLAALPAPAQSRCAQPPKGLSAWLTFDEPFARSAPASTVRGMVGAALAFDGKSQWAEAPPEPGFDVAEEDFAIECWLRTADGARIRNIADKRDAQPKGYLLFLQRGRVGFQVAGAASLAVVLAESRPIADNRWHHVVAVSRRLPPSPPTIYVDGVLAAKGTRNVPLDDLDNKARVWLGRHHANEVVPRDDIYFEGAIDEFTVYRRALDPAEIRALYRAGAAGKCHAPRSVRPARK